MHDLEGPAPPGPLGRRGGRPSTNDADSCGLGQNRLFFGVGRPGWHDRPGAFIRAIRAIRGESQFLRAAFPPEASFNQPRMTPIARMKSANPDPHAGASAAGRFVRTHSTRPSGLLMTRQYPPSPFTVSPFHLFTVFRRPSAVPPAFRRVTFIRAIDAIFTPHKRSEQREAKIPCEGMKYAG